MGETLPQPHRSGRRNRDSPGVRGRGLRTRVHARTQGTGSATASPDRCQKVTTPDRGITLQMPEKASLNCRFRCVSFDYRAEAGPNISALSFSALRARHPSKGANIMQYMLM